MSRESHWPRRVRLILAAAVLAFLCLSGYLRGYNAVDERTLQPMTTVAHDIDNLLGPDFSADGMMQTRQSLIHLVHSLHQGDETRAVQLNPIQSAGYSKLQVTTFPYLQVEIKRLLDSIRKPDR